MTEQEITCEKCWAACCDPKYNVLYSFTKEEAKMMREAGADLRGRWWGRRGYALFSPCPFLKNKRCTLHGTDKQPGCCRRFEPGSPGCKEIRGQLNDWYIH